MNIPVNTEFLSVSNLSMILTGSAGRVNVLNGLDLSVREGESIAVTGPSGSGKTTLLMVIAGLERPTNGSIIMNGHELTEMQEDILAIFRRDHIGILFQSFHLAQTMTALENVALPLELAGKTNAQALAREWLDQVELGARAGHYPGELSGGEQQRVGLARALINEPRLILADEPTGNLDARTGNKMADLLFSMVEKLSVALILITHDEDLARRCGSILRMRDGILTP